MRKKVTLEHAPEIVVGLDIGTTKIATVIGSRNPDGKIDIHSYGKGESTGVQHGLIYNINKTVNGINISKDMAQNSFNHDIREVFVGVAGRHIKSSEYKHTVTRINGKEDVIRQDEIETMVSDLSNISVNPGEQIINVIPQRFVIDRHRETTDPVGELGEIIEGYFQIITGNEGEIKKILRCVQDAGLDAETIILEPIASGLACLSHEEKKHGVVLIDIGGGTTDLAIFYDGKPVFTMVIPFGGNSITKDISTICKIPMELAEKLKIKHGTCVVEKSNSSNYLTIPQLHGLQPIQISENMLAEIIHARVQTDILEEIRLAIRDSGYASKITNGVVLTGGGSMLSHLKELCQYTLQMPVRIGHPGVGFVNMQGDLKSPIYSTVLGLLKYGIEGIDGQAAQIEEPVSVNEPLRKTMRKHRENYKDKGKEKEKKVDFFNVISDFFNDLLEKAT
ncbi:cell division protein FtsA [Bacteroidales bacterium OttesenSCG-928-B11]|nr:cell division protein FtsA [Bacteroidales bacterium OttesenSCG-928-C03]MDL2311817.1 cell division protein FtsA [Bacteroidales bacterium OttesenSCG-928-B11]